MTAVDPYVGPRPFQREEEDLFFGRLGESRTLISMILASRVVLLYALSGAGKTSLLNAAVVPSLEREEFFEVMPPARVRGPGARDSAMNPFVAGVMSHWAELGSADSLPSFLAQLRHMPGPDGFARPRAVIIDQLEEVFTAYPERWSERDALFRQLADALAQDPLLRLVLAIREDYLAQLEPIRSLLPGRLENRLRLELLDSDAACQAVTGPLRATSREFAPGVAERLVSDLRTTAVTDRSGRRREFEGEHIEPVQLQLACSALWRDLPADVTRITVDHLHAFGDVDQVLTDFYDEAIAAAALAAAVPESALRRQFTETFITPMHTRGTAYQSGERVGRVSSQAIAVLESRRVIRTEWRANARWFELTHDRLIDPIERSNEAALARTVTDIAGTVRGLLGAVAGVVVGAVPSGALIGVADSANSRLVEAVAIGGATGIAAAAAAVGRTLATTRTQLVRRALMGLLLAGVPFGVGAVIADAADWMVLLLVVGGIGAVGKLGVVSPGGWLAAVGAIAGTAVGVFAASEVLFSDTGFWGVVFVFVPLVLGAWTPHLVRVGRRVTATGDVRTTRQRRALLLGGAAAIVAAVAAGSFAILHANSARSARELARSRALAAQGTGSQDAELAGLLSVAAFGFSPTEQAEQAMVSALTRLQPSIRVTGGQVSGVAVSPDGRLAAAAIDSGVRLLDLRTRRTLALTRVPGGVAGVAFSRDVRRLAGAGDDGRIRIWQVPALTQLDSVRVGISQLGVAYSPIGAFVASGGEDGSVTVLPRSLEVKVISRVPRPVPAVAFSADGALLAAGSLDGTVRVMSFRTGRLDHRLAGQRGGVLSVAFGRTGTLAASGNDGTIRVWGGDGRALRILRGHTGSVFSVAFDSSGTLLASGGDDATVRVWAPRRLPRDQAVLGGFTASVLSVAFTPNGRTLVAGGADGRVWLLDHVLWSGAPREIEAAICARVNRSLTPGERRELLSDSPTRDACD